MLTAPHTQTNLSIPRNCNAHATNKIDTHSRTLQYFSIYTAPHGLCWPEARAFANLMALTISIRNAFAHEHTESIFSRFTSVCVCVCIICVLFVFRSSNRSYGKYNIFIASLIAHNNYTAYDEWINDGEMIGILRCTIYCTI